MRNPASGVCMRYAPRYVMLRLIRIGEVVGKCRRIITAHNLEKRPYNE